MGTEATERQPGDDGPSEEWQRRFLDDLAVVAVPTPCVPTPPTSALGRVLTSVGVHPFEARPRTTARVHPRRARARLGRDGHRPTDHRAAPVGRPAVVRVPRPGSRADRGPAHPRSRRSALRTGAGVVPGRPRCSATTIRSRKYFRRGDRPLHRLSDRDAAARSGDRLAAEGRRAPHPRAARRSAWATSSGASGPDGASHQDALDAPGPRHRGGDPGSPSTSAWSGPRRWHTTRCSSTSGGAASASPSAIDPGSRSASRRVPLRTPRVHAHAFRHTFATNMAEGGCRWTPSSGCSATATWSRCWSTTGCGMDGCTASTRRPWHAVPAGHRVDPDGGGGRMIDRARALDAHRCRAGHLRQADDPEPGIARR